MKTFLIEYEVYGKDGLIKEGEMRVKNQQNEMYAKTGLEDYLKRKYPDFSCMVVKSCKEDIVSNFGDIFGGDFAKKFGDMFGGGVSK